MLVQMQLDPARQRLIYGFFERYLKLTVEEEKTLMQEVRDLDPNLVEKIMEIPISHEEKGKEIGKEIATKNIARNMIIEGASVEFIKKVTNLSVDKILSLKKSINKSK